MSLTQFLLARIAEDKAAVDSAHSAALDTRFTAVDGRPIRTHLWARDDVGLEVSKDRVLAECAAKKAIVNAHRWRPPPFMACDGHPGPFLPHDDYGDGYCRHGADRDGESSETLRHLAAIYADHPDYRSEWAN